MRQTLSIDKKDVEIFGTILNFTEVVMPRCSEGRWVKMFGFIKPDIELLCREAWSLTA